MKLHEIIL